MKIKIDIGTDVVRKSVCVEVEIGSKIKIEGDEVRVASLRPFIANRFYKDGIREIPIKRKEFAKIKYLQDLEEGEKLVTFECYTADNTRDLKYEKPVKFKDFNMEKTVKYIRNDLHVRYPDECIHVYLGVNFPDGTSCGEVFNI